MRTTRLVMSLVGVVMAASLVHADAPQPANAAPVPLDAVTLTVDKKESSLVYHLIHKLHRVDGKSKAVDGRARLVPGGSAQVMIRVPVESFDSENTNRDQHMKEAVEAEKYPNVELRALVEGFAMPTTFPTTIDKTVKAQVVFHGVTQTLDVPIKIVVEAANRVRATASFSLSLDSFKVERPSLMFVKVNDKLDMDAVLVFTK